jgi:transposase InsO family protein
MRQGPKGDRSIIGNCNVKSVTKIDLSPLPLLLENHGMVASMSAKGNCWDNTVAESFFATLEFELQEGKPMANREDAKSRVGEFIEIYYNRQRAHQTLAYKKPIEMGAVA